jgi:hypothetical protein
MPLSCTLCDISIYYAVSTVVTYICVRWNNAFQEMPVFLGIAHAAYDEAKRFLLGIISQSLYSTTFFTSFFFYNNCP